jgi:hypothetical protein
MAIDWDAMVLAPLVGVFGEPVLYTPAGGAPFIVSMVCDEGNKDINLAGGMGVNSSNPVVSGRLAQFSMPPLQGDTLLIVRTGESFKVADVEADGKGGVKLPLSFMGPGL